MASRAVTSEQLSSGQPMRPYWACKLSKHILTLLMPLSGVFSSPLSSNPSACDLETDLSAPS